MLGGRGKNGKGSRKRQKTFDVARGQFANKLTSILRGRFKGAKEISTPFSINFKATNLELLKSENKMISTRSKADRCTMHCQLSRSISFESFYFLSVFVPVPPPSFIPSRATIYSPRDLSRLLHF